MIKKNENNQAEGRSSFFLGIRTQIFNLIVRNFITIKADFA